MGRRKQNARDADDGRRSDGMPAEPEAHELPADADPEWVEAVRRRLLEWYGDARRDLPWRADRDAYRILVSEFMLVQTTVAAVIPYFDRFLRQFPDIQSLARADEDAVLKAWEGLGYYRRARQLHGAARRVVELHGGAIPDDAEAVRALPGVGPYIAGAVLSFAFDRPEPIVEANSQRVLARLVSWRDDMRSAASRARVWQAAVRLVPPIRAGDFNQALMDLGATVCTPRQPSCLLCPLSSICRARAARIAGHDPPRVAQAAARVGRRGVCRGQPAGADPDRPAGARRALGPVLGVPDGACGGPGSCGAVLRRAGRDRRGRPPAHRDHGRAGPPAATIRYGVTNYRVSLEVSRGEARSGRARPGRGLIDARWVEPRRAARLHVQLRRPTDLAISH